MKPINIFITYNPTSSVEHTLASRVHSIGAVSGFIMRLPDRYDSESHITDETKSRIQNSDYAVMFSTGALSQVVKEEIEYAYAVLKDKSKILVIYDKQKGKNITGSISSHFTPLYIDPTNPAAVSSSILETVSLKEKDAASKRAVATLLGIGAGMLLLGVLTSNAPAKR